jgi:hypothetical protein
MLTAAYLIFTAAQVTLAALAIRLWRSRRSLGALTVALPIAALVWDNGVVAIGSLLGDGAVLQALSWPRFAGHALLTPIWIVTAVEYARRSGMERLGTRGWRVAQWGLYGAMAAYGFVRSVVLLRMVPVQQADIFYYTNGGGFPGPPAPAIVMVLCVIAAGVVVMRSGAGRWMLLGGVFMFLAALVPTSLVGFWLGNTGEVVLAAAMVATEALLQRREATTPG